MKSKMVWLVGCALVWSLSVTAALAQEAKVVQADRPAACGRLEPAMGMHMHIVGITLRCGCHWLVVTGWTRLIDVRHRRHDAPTGAARSPRSRDDHHDTADRP